MNNRKIPLAVIIFVVLVYLIVMAVSCGPAKKIEKAIQTVITDSAAFRVVGGKWTRLQPPCINDTITVDSTQVLILSDTTILPGTTDTITRPDTIRITQTKTNTVTKYIVDNRAIHELQDSLHDVMIRLAKKDGELLQLDKDRRESQVKARSEESRANRNWWLFIGAVALWGVGLIAGLLRKFRVV